MNEAWADEAKRILFTYAVPFGGRIVGAIVLWIVGRIIISAVQRLAERSLERRKLDTTLSRYVRSMIGVVLTILLLLSILSIFGVETASFAGILAAAGVAIGMAWSGLLSNFAAGVFMVVLRPFKVGDAISAAGVTGEVKEVGLFVTVIDTGDNIRTIVGNSKIFGDIITNYTENAHRRVDLKAQVAHSVDPFEAAAKLREELAKIPNVLKTPAPQVEILDFNAMGTVLAVRPFCHNNHYWDVYFATNDAIARVGSKAGYPAPETRHFVRKEA
jgi:small conductance mechanosensitive channel